jgi:hypothetical protein
MSKKFLMSVITCILLVMIVTPTVSACRNRIFSEPQAFKAEFRVPVNQATLKICETPNLISWTYKSTALSYTISVDDNTYSLWDGENGDFVYSDVSMYLVLKPNGESFGIYPLGQKMMFLVYYTYDFSAVPGGLEGKLKMRSFWCSDNIMDFVTPGTFEITSLLGSGDLRHVNIDATNGIGTTHVGTVRGWPV